jgi:hypothetical protein
MVLGLIIAQSLALAFTRGYAWRYILVIATALAATLLAVSVFVREGGKAADLHHADADADASAHDGADEQTALLDGHRRGGSEEDDVPEVHEDMSVKDVFRTRDKEVRRGCELSIPIDWKEDLGEKQ